MILKIKIVFFGCKLYDVQFIVMHECQVLIKAIQIFILLRLVLRNLGECEFNSKYIRRQKVSLSRLQRSMHTWWLYFTIADITFTSRALHLHFLSFTKQYEIRIKVHKENSNVYFSVTNKTLLGFCSCCIWQSTRNKITGCTLIIA